MILAVILTILAVALTATVLVTQPRTALMKALVPALVIGGTFGATVEANAQAGWYELGGGWACQVLPANEARHYGWLLTQPSSTETRIRNIASFLGRYAPSPWAKAVQIVSKCTAYAWYPLRWRIDWCANRSPYVYTYHLWGVPVWAYTTW